MPAILWFRNDLRLADNPALEAATRSGEEILPVFIYSPEDEGEWAPGGASKWWLHHSLAALSADLEKLGSKLIIRSGPACAALFALIEESESSAVFWNRRYEPEIMERDTEIKSECQGRSIDAQSFNGSLLFEPWEGCKADKKPYLVYTPFQNNLQSKGLGREVFAKPAKLKAPKRWPGSDSLESLALLPTLPWAERFPEFWEPGEKGAAKKLEQFLRDSAAEYQEGRDLPGRTGTSRLSPHLHFGEVGPNQVAVAIKERFSGKRYPEGVSIYVKEILWREFAHHLLYHFPKTPLEPLRSEFKKFPWRKNRAALKAWQKGMTGYPIVDAGMRELWKTGWMHNRVRMIVASFLVKDLLIPWQEGARWFWDTLVDADLANNTLGWQWTSGCGADAAPYFRVFNPVLQGEKFDTSGDYVKRWVPEISKLPRKWIHKPWDAPESVLAAAGVTLGREYPVPIVDHAEAREAALSAYDELKEGAAG